MITRVACSGYGQGRINNQPSTIGTAVPTARVSKKSEVFPGKMVWAIVEKRKADNPKPEMTAPVTVVLYIQDRGGNSQHRIADQELELTTMFGKLFATVFNAAEKPALLPIPESSPNRMSVKNVPPATGSGLLSDKS